MQNFWVGALAKYKRYTDRAVALLEQAVDCGYDFSNTDLDALRDHPSFPGLLHQAKLDRRYAVVRRPSAEFEAKDLHGLPPQEHRNRCHELFMEGYRPVAISVVSIGEDQPPTTASVWHRPLVAEESLEELAKRQANAAIGLMRKGISERVWALLQHQPEPRLRSRLIHRFSPAGVDAQTIADRLRRESDVSARRALILALGEYQGLTAAHRQKLTDTLCDLYRNHPDAGIHGASEWLLRSWGKTEEIEKIERDLATGQIEGGRQWYLTKRGQTLVVLPGPVEFLMGSPGTEKDVPLQQVCNFGRQPASVARIAEDDAALAGKSRLLPAQSSSSIPSPYFSAASSRSHRSRSLPCRAPPFMALMEMLRSPIKRSSRRNPLE